MKKNFSFRKSFYSSPLITLFCFFFVCILFFPPSFVYFSSISSLLPVSTLDYQWFYFVVFFFFFNFYPRFVSLSSRFVVFPHFYFYFYSNLWFFFPSILYNVVLNLFLLYIIIILFPTFLTRFLFWNQQFSLYLIGNWIILLSIFMGYFLFCFVYNFV